MEPNKNYLLVGTFVLSVVAAVFLFTLWVTKSSDGRNDRFYLIRYAESVSGLSVGSPVKFRGVDVGKVENIDIDRQNPNLIRVQVRITKSAPVKIDTVASLKLQGITGTSFVELSGGSPQVPDLLPTEDGELPEIPAESTGINAIVNRLPELVDKTNQVVGQAGQLLNEENLRLVNETLTSWRNMSAALEAQSGQMAELVTRSNRVMGNLDEATKTAGKDIQSITRALRDTTERINELTLRTSKAAGGNYEQFYQLVTEMKNATRDVRILVQRLDENPSRIVLAPEEKGIPAP